jgi:four helix bundle protein
MAQQLFRAASSIGAQLEEGEVAGSRRDMGAKHAIALREAREALYWLRMFMAAGVLVTELKPLSTEAGEFRAMLTASVMKLRGPEPEKQKE